jgi:hypothetical protein
MIQRVVCAANRNKDGRIVCGARHCDKIMRMQIGSRLDLSRTDEQRAESESWITAEQGFIDQFGIFLTREEAWKIAEANGQILRRVGGDNSNGGTLFSENLY